MRILIVDDDEDSRVFLNRSLTRVGHVVEGASDGMLALQTARKSPPDIIISDILLPQMDGFELCRRVKTDDVLRNIPFIFYTATYIEKRDEELGMQLGASRFLVKPMAAADLLEAIQEVIEAHKKEELPVPDRPLSDLGQLDRMHLETLTKKLGQKVRELEEERDALRQSQRRYQQLNETLEQRVKAAVEEVQAREQLLVRQGRLAAMGDLMASIAHQWRQPLNTLALIIQELPMYFARKELFTEEYLQESVARAMELIGGMSETIDSFRNFFRTDREKVSFKVSDALQSALSIVEATFRQLKLDIKVVVEEDVSIEGYPHSYSQAILNILMNAKDAFLQRKVKNPAVLARVFREGDRAVLLIRDNAGGIDEEVVDRIFDPYFTTKGGDKGTGIGLFMSKTIIEKNMNGSLSVRNIGEGAEFRLEV